MTDTPNEPLLVSSMRRHASNPRVHVRVGVPGAHSSISTTAAGFLAELDAYVEDVRAEARTVTAEQLEAAAGALFEEACGGVALEALDEGAARAWRVLAAVVLRAAGFTVVGEEEA